MRGRPDHFRPPLDYEHQLNDGFSECRKVFLKLNKINSGIQAGFTVNPVRIFLNDKAQNT
jgi:hypothetical protein